MRSERGQATIEWVGIVLLVSLALAALSHFAPKADGKDVGSAVLASVTRPVARSGARPVPRPGTRSAAPAQAPGEGAFAIPPLIPRAGESIPRGGGSIPRAGGSIPRGDGSIPRGGGSIPRGGGSIPRGGGSIPRAGELVADLRMRFPRARTLLLRARAGVGHAWRRAWIACLVYERFRYALLHPESRFPGHSIPPTEVLRMMNDCISPLDLVRDWPLMRGR